MSDTNIRKKLIEIAMPLEAINTEALRRKQKAPKGYPTSIHKYWAQRPIAACRAVLFAQLVDDPSSWPDHFPTSEEQATERQRLHNLIGQLVAWNAPVDVLNKARFEIARNLAWEHGEEPPPASDSQAVLDYVQAHAPPVYDPFCGAGSIPLEAQRLGLRAIGSDLNPVAVMISKALVEIPQQFAGKPPVNPAARETRLVDRRWIGAGGLADDVRYYGSWLREEALKRIGHLYPKVNLPDGGEAPVAAWIWARTVRSPDPTTHQRHVPLVSTFMLSTNTERQAWIEPILDRTTRGYSFIVHEGKIAKEQREAAGSGTRAIGDIKSKGGEFRCILSGAPISAKWIRQEGQAGRIGACMLAIIAIEGRRRRFSAPTEEQMAIANDAIPRWLPDGDMFPKALGFRVPNYGFTRWTDMFSQRQLVEHSTLCDLVKEAKRRVLLDIQSAGDCAGDPDATDYADAVAIYLSCVCSRVADYGSTSTSWLPDDNALRSTFPRQAIPMIWDYAEANPFVQSSGAISTAVSVVSEAIAATPVGCASQIYQRDASEGNFAASPVIFNTDPPYYANIGYADLSDFFYIWLRHSIGTCEDDAHKDLFRTLLTPKSTELVATPARHGGKRKADDFFMAGMAKALSAMRRSSDARFPVVIFYAYKQAEVEKDGILSPGWASFLQAVVDSGFVVDGTWRLRTEGRGRMRSNGSNALASSIVLVCRNRASSALVIEREDFVRTLRRELPNALVQIRAAGIGPVDMAQAAIGPGMGIFTRYSVVLEDSGEAMTVRTALALINQTRDEIDNEGDASYDLETRFALDWFSEAAWDAKESGRAILAANARNLSLDGLIHTRLIDTQGGKTRLIRRDEIPVNYDPAFDRTPIVWKAAQHLARALTAEDGGQDKCAAIMVHLTGRETIRALAYRLYGLCERKNWAAEALVWNRVAEEWRAIEDRAATMPRAIPDLFEAVR